MTATLTSRSCDSNPDGVSKDQFNPQTPQGGLSNLLIFNKSPLGDLGVKTRKKDYQIIRN